MAIFLQRNTADKYSVMPHVEIANWKAARVRLLEFEKHSDKRGTLVPFDFVELPFVPKRIFVVNQTPRDTIRGQHAHIKEEQALICINGSIQVTLRIGALSRSFILDRPELALIIPSRIWSAQKFDSRDTALLVISSTIYDPDDYLETYDE